MNANQRYADVFENHGHDVHDRYAAIRRAADAEWARECDAEMKRRRIKQRNKLPKPFLDHLRSDLFAKYQIDVWDEKCKHMHAERERLLSELAPQVVFEQANTWHRIDSGSASDYRSQGLNASRYAMVWLQFRQSQLEELGVVTHIRHAPGQPYSEYELWAACPEWMADAAQRLQSRGSAARYAESNGANSMVFG